MLRGPHGARRGRGRGGRAGPGEGPVWRGRGRAGAGLGVWGDRRRGPSVRLERSAGMYSSWGAALGAVVSVPVLLLVAAPYIRCVSPSAGPTSRRPPPRGGRACPRAAEGSTGEMRFCSLAFAGGGRCSRSSVRLRCPRRALERSRRSAQPRHRRDLFRGVEPAGRGQRRPRGRGPPSPHGAAAEPVGRVDGGSQWEPWPHLTRGRSGGAGGGGASRGRGRTPPVLVKGGGVGLQGE